MRHHVLACAAGVFGAPHDQDPELGRYDIELLANVLANRVKLPGTAGANLASNINDSLDAWQMGRQRAAIDAPLARALRSNRRRLCFGLGGGFRLGLFDVFEGEQQLIGGQRFGAGAEAMAL